ncbi:MAG: DNA modification methylase [Desulfobulbaceae bacterium]|nr:DNA modification methylase [Desulfobulbaceae bacterium]
MKVDVSKVVVRDRLRSLDKDTIRHLEDSISVNGLLQPIIISEDMVLLDGNHRLQACKNLGYTEIECIIKGIEELTAQLIEIDTNLVRKELSVIDVGIHISKREQILEILGKKLKRGDNQYSTRLCHSGTTSSGTPKSTQQLSKEMGVSRRDYYRKKSIVSNLSSQVVDRLIKTQWANSVVALQSLSREDVEIQELTTDRLINQYNGKPISNLDKVMRQTISEVKSTIAKDNLLYTLEQYSSIELDDRVQLFNDDFMKVDIPDSSIDLIFTDAPYGQEYLYLYENLGIFAKDKLKDGCFCLSYCSVQILPQVLYLMGKSLSYYHTICISYRPDSRARVGNISNLWKPLVMFYKGDKPTHNRFDDKLTSPDVVDKKLHRWQQPTFEGDYLIPKLTSINDVVCDVMMGTGTSGVSCINQGRRFIGIEIDRKTFDIAENTIKETFSKLKN